MLKSLDKLDISEGGKNIDIMRLSTARVSLSLSLSLLFLYEVYFTFLCAYAVPAGVPGRDKLSASTTKGKKGKDSKEKEGKESRSSKAQTGSRPSSQVLSACLSVCLSTIVTCLSDSTPVRGRQAYDNRHRYCLSVCLFVNLPFLPTCLSTSLCGCYMTNAHQAL